MAFGKEELEQLKDLFDEQTALLDKKIDRRVDELHSRISLDMRMALSPIERELHEIKELNIS